MITVALPWPAKELMPNGGHGHWAPKAKALKAAKAAAHWKMREQSAHWSGFGLYEKAGVNVSYTFHPGTNRRRDLDNLIASTKATTDGIAQALCVDDSTFKLSYTLGEIRKPACVVVVIS